MVFSFPEKAEPPAHDRRGLNVCLVHDHVLETQHDYHDRDRARKRT